MRRSEDDANVADCLEFDLVWWKIVSYFKGALTGVSSFPTDMGKMYDCNWFLGKDWDASGGLAFKETLMIVRQHRHSANESRTAA